LGRIFNQLQQARLPRQFRVLGYGGSFGGPDDRTQRKACLSRVRDGYPSSPIAESMFFTSPTQLPESGDESSVIACLVERMGKEGVLNVHEHGDAGNGVVHTVYAVLVVVCVE